MEESKAEVAQEKPKASVVGWVEPSNCVTRRWSGLEYQNCERIALSFFGFFPSFSDSCSYRCVVIGAHRRSLRWALGHLKRYHVEVHPSRVLISVLLGPRLLHRDIAVKTVVNLSTPRKLVPHFHSKAAGWGKSRCAAQEAEEKRQSEVCWRKQRRCRSWKSWDGPPSRGD